MLDSDKQGAMLMALATRINFAWLSFKIILYIYKKKKLRRAGEKCFVGLRCVHSWYGEWGTREMWVFGGAGSAKNSDTPHSHSQRASK